MSEPAAGPSNPLDEGQSQTTATSDYAFLVHSQQTLPLNLPPNVDNKPLARQRRRRTSPEDQTILEAEYHRNPKPDKIARQDIVKRVALGDKEVQIWFQNRRQNDRRKSRPLLPHELPPLSLSESESYVTARHVAQQAEADDNRDVDDALEDLPAEETDEAVVSSQDTTGTVSQDATRASQSSCEAIPTVASSYESQQTGTLKAPQCRTGYLANRRNIPGGRSSWGLRGVDVTTAQPADSTVHRDRGLKKSTSQIRISMTSEGNAKVLTNDDSSPSPPRLASIPAGNSTNRKLSRSQSAVSLKDKFIQAVPDPPGNNLPRGAAGRSRDSRAWEFWCDSDSRNALAEKADQDAGGSAADAIGLMRSNSRTVLGSNPNKRNARMNREDSAKRFKADPLTGPKLARSTSDVSHIKMKVSIKQDRILTAEGDVEVPNNESDKENWEPNGQSRQPLRTLANTDAKPKPAQVSRTILGESSTVPSQESSLGAMLNRERPRKTPRGQLDRENISLDDDPEIAEFMGTRNKRNSGTNASGDDFDCVQGLLSLSQGNWR
ncbi:MAG: hypothetical protein M1820_003421 [Bogoriella megaspora]|nr:MAG: hypothetical protein M1820_003421 [Bogoriella megaspora]